MIKEKLIHLSKKYCTAVLSLVILLLVLSNIILPSINSIKQLDSDIFKEREKIEELYLKGQSLKRSTEEYYKIKKDISELENIFISQDQELRLITDIETLAKNNNVIQEINIKENNKDNDKEKMFIELSVTGLYRNLINYLQAIEELDIYINFNNIRFSLHDNLSHGRNSQPQETLDTLNPNVTLYLNGIAYYWLK